MPRAWILLLLLLLSSLPVIVVFIWFRLAKYQFSLYRFLLALLAGAAAFFPALILQDVLTFSFHSNRATLFFEFFIRIAFTEEFSRFLILLVFFWVSTRISTEKQPRYLPFSDLSEADQQRYYNSIKKATATGLIAGLSFALLENAVYAASDINVLPLRIIITAAVHAACGARIGAAAVMIYSSPIQAILRILSATAIHGIYNLLVTMSGFSPLIAIFIAISALFSAIVTISGGWSYDTADKQNYQDAPAIDKNNENS